MSEPQLEPDVHPIELPWSISASQLVEALHYYHRGHRNRTLVRISQGAYENSGTVRLVQVVAGFGGHVDYLLLQGHVTPNITPAEAFGDGTPRIGNSFILAVLPYAILEDTVTGTHAVTVGSLPMAAPMDGLHTRLAGKMIDWHWQGYPS